MGPFPGRKDLMIFRWCGPGLLGWGRCDRVGRAPGRAGMGGLVSPRVWGTLCLASPAPETVKLIKAVELQD